MASRRDFLFLSKRQKRRRLETNSNVCEIKLMEKVCCSTSRGYSESTHPCSSSSSRTLSPSTAALPNLLSNLSEDGCSTGLSSDGICSSDSENSNSEIPQSENYPSFSSELKRCFTRHNVNQNCIKDILSILRKHGHEHLPQDARTFMKTPRKNEQVITMNSGHYVHFGLIKNVKRIISQTSSQIPQILELNINVDGLPLTKSSNSQFWPILGDLIALPTKPFIIGLYHGLSKPSNVNDFLKYFVEEYKPLQTTPLNINNKIYYLQLNCIIADAPAKAFITNCKGHNAYYGCSKCVTEGSYLDKVVFPETNAALRTNESFRNRSNEEHHKSQEITILETLNFDLVEQIPLDYMHLVLLGVMKKLLSMWVKGNAQVRLKKTHLIQLDEVYIGIKKFLPLEFSRKPRTVLELDRWKATEFRLFLLYVGPVILKKFLSGEAYNHFLSLSVAVRLLCEKKPTANNIRYANELLLYFVKKYKHFYGEINITYNVHNLIHLSKDVENHGSLENFSAFKFENFMYELKKLLKNSRNPLQQVSNRVIERWEIPEKKCETFPVVKKKKGCLISARIHNFEIILNEKDCFVLLENDKIMKIHHISESNGNILFHGKEYINTTSLFSVPYISKSLGFTVVKDMSQDEYEFTLDHIKNKCFWLPTDTQTVLIPLLH